MGQGLIDRLPEVLAGPNTHVRVVGPADAPLSRSIFVDEYIETVSRVCGPPLAEELISRPELRSRLQGRVIFADDETPRVLAESDLSVEEKIRILPASNPEAFGVLGSKVGLAGACERLGIPSPRQSVVRSASELADALARVGYPCLIKTATGGGGAGITRVQSASHVAQLQHTPFPLVVQECVDGREIMVDVAFLDGRVTGWLYAQAVDVTHEFGPSTVRRYQYPPGTDFIGSLETLASWGQFSGLFNCTFIREESSGRHLLIEADPRPNAWHQFGPGFQVDWRRALTGVGNDPLHPVFGLTPIELHLYPREFAHALNSLHPSLLNPWLNRSRGTWDTRSHRDAAVNTAEAISVVGPGFVSVLQPPWRLLPHSFRDRPLALKAKSRVLGLLGIPWFPPQDRLSGERDALKASVD